MILCVSILQLNFDEPLEAQGPFDVILHKLTDQLTRTQEGSQEAVKHIEMIQQFVLMHPEVTIIDPIENVLMLLDRRRQYEYVRECDVVDAHFHYFIPSFAELTTADVNENKQRIAACGVQYPIVCKPSLSHCSGQQQQTTSGHVEREEMAIVFSEAGLADIEPPCVAQTFINHNARLFKIFIVGSRYFIIQRPSIKNFSPGDHKTIFFNSNDVSKSYSSSFLNKMEASEVDYPVIEPDERKMIHLVAGLQKKFGLDLLGIDVIIENGTGRYAVIDINVFPGYDGVQEFFPALLELIQQKIYNIPKADVSEETAKLEPGLGPTESVKTCENLSPAGLENGSNERPPPLLCANDGSSKKAGSFAIGSPLSTLNGFTFH